MLQVREVTDAETLKQEISSAGSRTERKPANQRRVVGEKAEIRAVK